MYKVLRYKPIMNLNDIAAGATDKSPAVPVSGDKPSAKTKWGSAVTGGDNGYSIVPDALLRKQLELKLDPMDVVLILNIAIHWWENEPGRLPYPRPVVIAKRMGTSTRTIERRIARLCKLGLMEWLPSESRKGLPSIRKFSLQGLANAMERLANDPIGRANERLEEASK